MSKDEAICIIQTAMYYQDDTTDMGETLDHSLEHLDSSRSELQEAFSYLSSLEDK